MGLSHVSGDLVFDRSRMLFDSITAHAGGGQLQLNGAVNYGEGPLRYELTASTTVVRIRYPAGMSWLAVRCSYPVRALPRFFLEKSRFSGCCWRRAWIWVHCSPPLQRPVRVRCR